VAVVAGNGTILVVAVPGDKLLPFRAARRFRRL